MKGIGQRDMVEIRLVFDDGSQMSRYWTAAMIMGEGQETPLDAIKDPPAFLREPRKTWAHPQDPLIFSALVADSDASAAADWLDSLGGEARE